MKKNLFLIVSCSLFLVPCALSQNVGIGVPNPQNKLHVGGGFRLDTLTGVGGAGLVRHDANGVVYGIKFSGNSNDVLRGDGSFGAFNVNGAIGWLLNGNSGTNPATNFIGTSDDASLVFKIRNLHSGIIDSAQANSSFGYRTLSQNTTGSGNNAFGFKSLFSNTTGTRNTAVGNEALSKNDVGNDNTAVGFNALSQNRFLSYPANANTAMGSGALYSNVNGNSNTANGFNALKMNLSGTENCAFGISALQNNTAFQNNAFGAYALSANTTGSQNSAFGHNALASNTTGYENTAFGWYSLLKNNSYLNSAFGNYSLLNNTSGHNNTAIGNRASYQNMTGSYNTATGSGALQNNTGNFNSAVGFEALKANNVSASDHNSALGYRALELNAGLGNTGVGTYALNSNVTGILNTAIGALAGSALPNNVSNVTCIGYAAGWNSTLNNHINIGNTSVQWIGGQTGWFHYSDKRMKNDINENVPGLSFITRLKPVTYQVDIDKQEEIANAGKQETNSELIRPVQKSWEGKYNIEKTKMTGFLAQDVEEAARSINYLFNGVHNPKNGGLLSLDYSAFVVPLVKAVQEQQTIIEKQQKQIDELIKRIEALEKK